MININQFNAKNILYFYKNRNNYFIIQQTLHE